MVSASAGGARGVEDLPTWVRRTWLIPLVIGLALLVIGVLLLVNLHAGVGTLRWLIVISLALSAIEAFATASLRVRPWVGWVAGLIYLAGAVVGIVWPRVTLLALVIVVGVSLLVAGILRAALSYRARGAVAGWGWSFTVGLLSALAGLFFLFGSPVIGVVVLAVVLGCYVIFSGVILVVLSFAVRRIGIALTS